MGQVILALRWYLVVQVFGLAALPLVACLFRYLPDRGYGVSKPLGLLLAGWVFWLLVTVGWLHNTAGGIVVALAVVAAAGIGLHLARRPPDRAERVSWVTILVAEALFALAFAGWCVVRSRMPRIETAGGEKWMEIAFLRAILRSNTFPPHDPWLSGFAISYYYFGYVIVAMVTRMAAVPPSIAFNLGIAMLFGLTCTGAFSLVHNLIAAGRRESAPGGGPARQAILGGLLGSVLVAVMGNLEAVLEILHARGLGSASFWRWLDIVKAPLPRLSEQAWIPQRFIWWWQASRVVRDYTPWGDAQEVIDEFPAFSFLLGDMHPHVLALPFVLLALALAFNLYRRASLRPEAWSLRLFRWTVPFPMSWELPIYAICLGGLGFLNTWDFPIYLFVVAAAYASACLHTAQSASRFAVLALRFGSLFGVLLLLGFLFYFPFWLSFQSQAKGVLPNLVNGTRFSQFLIMFGPLLFIAAAFAVGQARRSGVQAREVVRLTWISALCLLVVPFLVLGLGVLSLRLGLIPAGSPPLSYIAAWLQGEPVPGVGVLPGVGGLLRNRFLLDPGFLSSPSGIPLWAVAARSVAVSPLWTTLGLVAFLVVVALTLKRVVLSQQEPALGEGRGFILLLLSVGALLVLSVEYVYLRDHFGTRMNTVFKFYFQAWVLWAIGGAYALSTLLQQRRMVAWSVATCLVVAGLIYPLLAIPKRAAEQGGPATLDGAAHLADWYPGDYAAINWLNANVGGAPVILEAPGGAYDYEGRVSAHTGLPTVLGWSGHEGQWRGSYEEQGRRGPDIETLYASVDLDTVLTLLDKYGISYVYVGPVERERYPAAGLEKFAVLMDAVYRSDTVTIYRRR